MGWLWADAAPATPALPRDHPTAASGLSPPPACPMHRPDAAPSTPTAAASACPYPGATASASSSAAPSDAEEPTGVSALNPLNFMFANLPQTRAAGQQTALPTAREPSSIPKADGSLWEYPSPQQMFNAMRRKGFDGTPEDAIVPMVDVHNFLNEGAWHEIRAWEAEFGGGVLAALTRAAGEPPVTEAPRLARFQGRRNDVTPKAQWLQFMGRVWPEKYAMAPPFDRHDWYVLRARPDGTREEKRYVIDYYGGPTEEDGTPVFYLDVRPAVDNPTAAAERVVHWGKKVWDKASGMDVREKNKEEARRAAKDDW